MPNNLNFAITECTESPAPGYSKGVLTIVPLSRDQANALVAQWHRHHQRVTGHRFALGVRLDDDRLVGAVIVGRPTARLTDQWTTCEVTRLVTNGTPNACSKLYGAAARVAKAMGFTRIQTFILDTEPGTSLRAAGWTDEGLSAGGDWNRPSRGGRRRDQPETPKRRWAVTFALLAITGLLTGCTLSWGRTETPSLDAEVRTSTHVVWGHYDVAEPHRYRVTQSCRRWTWDHDRYVEVCVPWMGD